MPQKILIIKLGSSGDVLRTTSILSGLKNKYPDSLVTWLVNGNSKELLEGNPNIDKIVVHNDDAVNLLSQEKFDIVLSLDKATEGTRLASSVSAEEKYGFGIDEKGGLRPLNELAEYSYRLGMDDDLKFFKNRKTYQELTYEMSGLNYRKNAYELILGSGNFDFADNFFKVNGLNGNQRVIGVNTGAGSVFANKYLKKERIIELIRLLKKEMGAKILLLGGPSEKDINGYVMKGIGNDAIDGGCENSVKDFAALINRCSAVIAADTLAMHIAIALKKPVVALFGPTCSREIDLYGRGQKIVTTAGCAPCYKNKCNKKVTCMDKIDLNEIVRAVQACVMLQTDTVSL
ncbi:MAG: glycosyltransferase family 9 protein [Candidatus Omnitrophota bacterium]|jgi:heptosyltransferase-2